MILRILLESHGLYRVGVVDNVVAKDVVPPCDTKHCSVASELLVEEIFKLA